MPRTMRALHEEFEKQVESAIGLARAGEMARTALSAHTPARQELTSWRLVLMYEMAYLRIFCAWEVFLEETLIRYIAGHQSRQERGPLQPGVRYASNIAHAKRDLYQGRHFLLWHDPGDAIKRARRWLNGSQYELVVASATSDLGHFASIRHRIAHDQEDARANFDQATMHYAGRRYRGGRPGRFLRDEKASASPPTKWLKAIGRDLVGLANQMV